MLTMMENAVSINNNTNQQLEAAKTNIEMNMIFPGIYLSSLNVDNYWTPEMLRSHGFTHIIRIDKQQCNSDSYINNESFSNHHHNHHHYTSHTNGFEILDLNFGFTSYLTMVLPNCYKAVKFIDKAMVNGGAVLIIVDSHSTNEEKCITIVVGYLMYKHNLQFR